MTAIGRVTVGERKGEEGDSKRVRGVRVSGRVDGEREISALER